MSKQGRRAICLTSVLDVERTVFILSSVLWLMEKRGKEINATLRNKDSI